MSDKRIMRISNKVKMDIKPDTVRVVMTLRGHADSYGLALKKSADDTQELCELVMKYGFWREDIKTVHINITVCNNGYRDDVGMYKERFSGYDYIHVLKVEFDAIDSITLGRLLQALCDCALKPEFTFCFIVKDPEAAKNELVTNAVKMAKNKALVLSKASGVLLGDIRCVEYSFNDMNLVSPQILSSINDYGPDSCIDCVPEPFEVVDDVTIEWEII